MTSWGITVLEMGTRRLKERYPETVNKAIEILFASVLLSIDIIPKPTERHSDAKNIKITSTRILGGNPHRPGEVVPHTDGSATVGDGLRAGITVEWDEDGSQRAGYIEARKNIAGSTNTIWGRYMGTVLF